MPGWERLEGAHTALCLLSIPLGAICSSTEGTGDCSSLPGSSPWLSFLPLHPTGTSWLSMGQSNPEQAPRHLQRCGWDGQAAAKKTPCLAKPWGAGVSPGDPVHRREESPGFGTPRDRGWSSKEKPALFPSAHCLEMPSCHWTCGVVRWVPAARHCPACAQWQPAGCPIQRVPAEPE